jgi:hypothetical protein
MQRVSSLRLMAATWALKRVTLGEKHSEDEVSVGGADGHLETFWNVHAILLGYWLAEVSVRLHRSVSTVRTPEAYLRLQKRP